MHYRIFLLILLLTGLKGAFAADRPNVLFMVADDLNTRIGPYNGIESKTPNLDRLADEGVRFTRAYCQFPLCGPSRASFMSGLYPETTRVLGNRYEPGSYRSKTPALADHPTLAGFFRQNGYYTARVSKIFHMGVPGGIERGEMGADDPDSWDYAVNIMAPETMSRGDHELLSPKTRHYGSAFLRVILPNGTEMTQADPLATSQALAILENRAGKGPPKATNRTKFKPKAPFFLAVGFVRPHVPLIAPERHFESHAPESVALPDTPDQDLADVPAPAGRQNNQQRYGMDRSQQKKAIAAYQASISFMDEQVGRLLEALDRLGLRDNTIVVFFSDHGYNLGEHHCWQKMSLWEESVRTPLIISAPGFKQSQGEQRGAVVELIDLYPTLAELCGLADKAPSRLQGESLAPLLQAHAGSDSGGEAYTLTRGGGSLRTAHWRYNRWGDQAKGNNEELYDHRTDAGEHTNLARHPRYAAELERMRDRFDAARQRARSGL